MKRLARALAIALALLAAGVPATAAPGPTPPAGAALEPSSEGGLEVTGVRSTPSELQFFLGARSLPAEASLLSSAVSVRARGADNTTTELNTEVEPITELANAPSRAVVVLLELTGTQARRNAVTAAVAQYVVASPRGVAFGIVALTDRPTTVLAPTTDRDDFIDALRSIGPARSHDLAGAVAQANTLLSASPGAGQYRSSRIMAVSDGAVTNDPTGIASTAAKLAEVGRPVDAIGLGSSVPAGSPLSLLTSVTGGRLEKVSSVAQLQQTLGDSANWLGSVVQVTSEVPAGLSGQSVSLQVSARDSGAVLGAAAATVKLAVDPSAVAAAPVAVTTAAIGRGWMLAMGLLLLAVVFVWATVGWFVPAVAGSEGKRAMARLQRILDFRTGGRRSRFSPAAIAAVASDLAGRALLRDPRRRAKIELALERAGSLLTPDQWVAARIGVGLGAWFLFTIVLSWWAGLLLGVLFGWLGTGHWLRSRAAKRARAFAEQLPDSLRVVVGSLRSGFSLHQAIDSVAGEGNGPVAVEFRRALAEIRLGGDLEEALERVADRNNSRDVRWLVMALRIQSDVGGSLAEVVETTVQTMRERGRLERTVRALSAEGRLSAIVLVCLPLGVGGFMFLVRRPYLRPLYTTTMGLGFLIGAIVLICVGWVWMSKLVKVEV